MPGPKNGERPYLAPPKPVFLGPILGPKMRVLGSGWAWVRSRLRIQPALTPISGLYFYFYIQLNPNTWYATLHYTFISPITPLAHITIRLNIIRMYKYGSGLIDSCMSDW